MVTVPPRSSRLELPLIHAADGPTRARVYLLAITIAGGFLRLLWLGRKSFWLDEGVSYLMATDRARPHDSFWAYQALYHELLRYWIKLGDSEFVIRLFSVIPGIATIPVVYLLGKRLFNRRIGLYSAFLIAVHVTLVTYSQQARGYALVVFLASVATYFFLCAIELDKPSDWVLYFLLSALAIYSHLLSVLVIPAQFLSVLALPSRAVPWRRLVLCAIALTAVAIPPAWIILRGGAGGTEFIAPASYLQLPNVIAMLAGDAIAVPCYLVFWVIAALWVRRTVLKFGRSMPAYHAALLLSWCATPIVLLLLVSVVKPAFLSRYLLVCAPPAVLLAARGLAELRLRPRVLLLAATVLLSLAAVIYHQTRRGEDWRGAAQYVFAHALPGDDVLVLPPFARLPFVYYQHRFGADSIPLEPTDNLVSGGEWLAGTASYRRLWVVIYTRPGNDPSKAGYLDALARDFQLQDQQRFKWVDVQLYVPSLVMHR